MTSSPAASMGKGIGLALFAFGLFSTMDMFIKLTATGGMHVAQVAFFNALFSLLPLSVLFARLGGPGAARTQRLNLHLARGAIGISGALCSFYAYSVMPMADAYSIAFSAPLFITALSVPILKEPVGWRRWAAVAVGFAGVMVMLRPGAGAIGLGSLAALAGAFAYASSVMIIRILSRSETTAAMMLYPTVTALTVTGAALPFVWTPMDLGDVAALAAAGTCGGVAQIALIMAFRSAPAAVVAPFQYSQLLWGAAYGAVIFGNFPDAWTYVGAPIVIGSGLYILWRETRRRETAQPAAVITPAPEDAPVPADAARASLQT